MDDWFAIRSPAGLSILKEYLSNHDGVITAAKKSRSLDYYNACLLKKASIICSIKDSIADGSVTEEILDSLVLIEEVDREQGVSVSASMTAAFCAVAVHCTLTHLTRSWHCYYDAVQRIWNFKIRNLEHSESRQLIGEDLTRWREDVEAALWDTHTSQRLSLINSRGKALLRLRVYLEEARCVMKPTFRLLALIARVDPPASVSASEAIGYSPEKEKGNSRVNSQEGLKPGASQPVMLSESGKEQPTSLSSAEVNKVRHALKSSMAALRSVVTDPLPEALEVAERVASKIARNILPTEAIVEERNKDKEVPSTSANPMEKPALAERIAPGMKGKDLQAKATDQDKVLRPSLMERNGTARSHEWEDSIEVSPEGTSSSSRRCRLPSPKLQPVSPLKRYQPKEDSPKKWKRKRKRNPWSLEEEEALRKGVEKYGHHWKEILLSNLGTFINRTDGDLKDKWRNMGGV